MIAKTISTEKKLWRDAQRKAHLVPISAVIRELLKKWLAGEVDLTSEVMKNEN